MCLCILVVIQDTSYIKLYKLPIIHYLVVRGVDEKSGTLRAPFFYTSILASALQINWLIILEVAIPLEAQPSLRLKSKAAVESIHQQVYKLYKEHLCKGSFSPIASILSQLARGKAFNKLHFSQPNIHQLEDEQTIYYLRELVALSKIYNICNALTQELQETIKELTFRSNVPSIDLSSIVDSILQSQAFYQSSYSFTKYIVNRGRIDVGYQYLFERAKGESKSKGKSRGSQRLLRKSRASQKMEQVDG